MLDIIGTILLYAGATFALYKLSADFMGSRKVDQAELQKRASALPQDTALYYLQQYTKVFQTQNLLSVVSLMSDVFYSKIAGMLGAYAKLGIRKEIELSPYPPSDIPEDEDEPVDVQGNRDMSFNFTYFKVLERFIDNQTNRVIYERYRDKVFASTILIRGSHRTEAEKLFCTGCGNPIDTSGETFVCKYCGATYRADSFDWVLDSVEFGLVQMKNPFVRVALIFSIVGIAAIPLSILTLFIPFLVPLLYLCNLTYVGYCIWGIFFTRKMAASLKELQAYDPGEAELRIYHRFENVLQQLYFSAAGDLSEVRADLDPNLVAQFTANPPRTTHHVLEVGVIPSAEFKYYQANNRQYIEDQLTLNYLLLTADRQVAALTKKVPVRFYRNLNTRVSNLTQMQGLRCSGCGSPLSLTARCTCKYCGVQYDMADFDWKLESIDPTAFDFSGATILPPPITLRPSFTPSQNEQDLYQNVAARRSGQETPVAPAPEPEPAFTPAPPPPDSTPENLLGIVKCEMKKEKGGSPLALQGEKLTDAEVYQNCFLMITNKRFTVIPAPEEEGYQPGPNLAVDLNQALVSYRLHAIHTYQVERILTEAEVHLYLYDGSAFSLQFERTPFAQFKQLLEQVLPGVTEAPYKMSGQYHPGISDRDPRNPYGRRYNQNHPRTHTVAYTKQLKKNPSALDEIIAAYKQEGTVPTDFNILSHGTGAYEGIPGIPCFYDGFI